MKKKPMIYIAGPYSQGDQFVNVRKVIDVAEDLMKRGFVPIIPHFTAFWNFVYYHSWESWLEYDKQLLLRCDGLLRVEGESVGADEEMRFAGENDIPVFVSVSSLIYHYY